MPKVHRELPIDLDELATMMSENIDESRKYFDTQTGTLHLLPDDLFRDSFLSGVDADDDAAGGEADLPEWERAILPIVRAIENDETGRYVELPEPDPADDAKRMRDFAYTLDDESERERLLDALSGSHPFRRFRQSLNNQETREAWWAYRDARNREWAAGWLETLGIKAIPRPRQSKSE